MTKRRKTKAERTRFVGTLLPTAKVRQLDALARKRDQARRDVIRGILETHLANQDKP